MSTQRNRDEDTPTNVPMTPEQMSRVLRKIERALCGDPYNQSENPGFLSIITELHRDYYGDKTTGRMGTKDMVLRLWEMRIKIVGICGAASVLAWVIEMVIQYHAK